MDDVDRFLANWHRTVAERDLEALRALLAEDVSLGAPPYWTRLEDRALVHHLLGLILNTIEDFTYHREWRHGSELALEFKSVMQEFLPREEVRQPHWSSELMRRYWERGE